MFTTIISIFIHLLCDSEVTSFISKTQIVIDSRMIYLENHQPKQTRTKVEKEMKINR